MIRIGFFGTPSLAASVLRDLLDSSDFETCFVVSNPDKPFGRDQIMKPTPVKDLAMSKNIPVFTPTKIRKNKDFLNQLRSYHCDYFVVVAYGRILPEELLDIPEKMCINVHGSILPKYRGASPIQSALLHGEEKTGVTIMQMSVGMDEGDVLKIREIPVEENETAETLFIKFANISGPTLIQTLLELEHGGITPLPQDTEQATYCEKIEKEDGLVDWSKSAKEIYNAWQAYTPWPGIFTHYEGKRLLLEITNYIPQAGTGELRITNTGKVGQVTKLGDGIIGIICGEGILTLEQVKLEGKKSQSIKDFVNGNQRFISSIL